MQTLFTELDPYTGIQTEYLSDGKKLIERTTASQAHTHASVDHTRMLANDPSYSAAGIKADWWHAASVPGEVWLRWKNEGFDIFSASTEDILKKLRDPDYAYLRATSGRI
jgi:hypothetical protein